MRVLEVARGVLEPGHFALERGGALDQRGLLGPRFGDEPHLAPRRRRARTAAGDCTPSEAALGVALLRSRAARWRPRTPRGAARPRALRLRRGCARSRRRRAGAATRAQFVGRRGATCASRPTIAFSCPCCSVTQRGERRLGVRGWPRRARDARPQASGSRRAPVWTSSRSDEHLGAAFEDAADVLPRSALDEPGAAEDFAGPRGDRNGDGARQRRAPLSNESATSARPMSRATPPACGPMARTTLGERPRARRHDERPARPARRDAGVRRARRSRSGPALRPRAAPSAARRHPRPDRRPRAGGGRRAARPPRARTIARPAGDRRRRRGGARSRRLAEQEARGVAERGAAGLELLERPQPRFLAGELALARGERLAACVRGRRAGSPGPLRPRPRAAAAVSSAGRALRRAPAPRRACSVAGALGFGAELARLDLEALALGGHAIAHRGRVVAGLTQRRERRARRGEDRGARRVRFLLDGLHGADGAARSRPRTRSTRGAASVERLPATRRGRFALRVDRAVAPARGGPRARATRRRTPRPAAPAPRSAARRTGSAAGDGRSRARARAPVRAWPSRRPRPR